MARASLTIGTENKQYATQLATVHLKVHSSTASIPDPALYPVPVILSGNPSKPEAYELAFLLNF